MPLPALVHLESEAAAPMPSSGKAPLPPNEDADNPLYKEDNFRMWCLKVLPCSKRYCHDWTTCPWAHAQEKAKRRDPRVYNYTGVACPEMKKSMQCPRGDQCPYAHNVFEYWLHHSRYRTQLCNDGVGCKRKICFFAHTLDELRVSSVKVQVPEGFRGDINSTSINPFANDRPSGKQQQAAAPQHGNGNPYGPAQRNGGAAGGAAGQNGLSMAELQQLGALQAKLQASQQQQGMYGAPGQQLANGMGGDQAALDQLVQLMLMSQPQQAGGQQLMGDPMHLMAQMMLGQQQQQAAAALQVQQQVAALQLLNQMGGMMPDSFNGAAGDMMGGGQARYPGTGPPASMHGRGNSFNGYGAPQGRSSMPHAAVSQHQLDSPHVSDSVNELARQLSGLSASGKLQVPPVLMNSGGDRTSDGPGSARSFASAGTPHAGGRHGMSRVQRQNTHEGTMGMGIKAPQGDAHGGAAGGGPQHVSPGGGARSVLQHTSPVSVSALGDGYATTATANSYFSASHSLSSSHDGSDLEGSHQ